MTGPSKTTEAIKAFLRNGTEISRETVGAMTKTLVARNGSFQVCLHGATETDVSSVLIDTNEPEVAVHIYDSIDGVEREWGEPWLPRGFNNQRESIKQTVFAAGGTVEECLRGFADSIGNSGIGNVASGPTGEPGGWEATFTSGGTGFKAAGVYVPGGAIMTWWK